MTNALGTLQAPATNSSFEGRARAPGLFICVWPRARKSRAVIFISARSLGPGPEVVGSNPTPAISYHGCLTTAGNEQELRFWVQWAQQAIAQDWFTVYQHMHVMPDAEEEWTHDIARVLGLGRG
jgi:hypothetical protein